MRKKGFTLIELMIVVVIIAIIAVIAVPNLLESRKAANESAAIGNCKTILNCQFQFRTLKKATLNNAPRYAAGFPELVQHALLDSGFSDGNKQSYNYILSPGGGQSTQFTCVCSPVSAADGGRAFYVDDSGSMTYSTGPYPNSASAGLD